MIATPFLEYKKDDYRASYSLLLPTALKKLKTVTSTLFTPWMHNPFDITHQKEDS